MPPKWLMIAVGVWVMLSIAVLVAVKVSLH